MKALKGYFNNLATSEVNIKLVLERRVANNTKLAANNNKLFAMVKKLTNEIKNIERETSHLKKTGRQGKRDPTLCPHCKNEDYHEVNACFELVKNKDKRPTGWKSLLWRRGTVRNISNISKSNDKL